MRFLRRTIVFLAFLSLSFLFPHKLPAAESSYSVQGSTPIVTSTEAYTSGGITVFNFPNPFDCGPKTRALNSGLFKGGRQAAFIGTMIRMQLPPGDAAQLRIRIYNVAGEEVISIGQGLLPGGRAYYSGWNCRNRNGRSVASGVYIGVISWAEHRKAFKMAVVKGSGL